uniref:Uncharacterized protein n=1 Tax=Arundo donax TaxID=35708 RepID=A0A0A9D454_ARUDO
MLSPSKVLLFLSFYLFPLYNCSVASLFLPFLFLSIVGLILATQGNIYIFDGSAASDDYRQFCPFGTRFHGVTGTVMLGKNAS